MEANLDDVAGSHPLPNVVLGAVLELLFTPEEGVEELSAELPEEKAVFPTKLNTKLEDDEPG